MLELWALENEIYDGGVRSICGVDEAGRGPLAGPVCAAAVVLPRGTIIEGLNDSKKLSEKRRETLFDEICEKALEYNIAFASVEEIEELNILNATFLAMNRAISGLDTAPELALIDGNQTRGIDFPCRSVVGGDGKCADIAAAPDGFIAAIMEPVNLPEFREPAATPEWAVVGCGSRERNLLLNGGLNEEHQLSQNRKAEEMYKRWEREDVMVEEYLLDDAEYVIAAIGTSARICRTVINELREEGIKVGMIRPITISPFPYSSFEKLGDQVKYVIDVEMSVPAQMILDVKVGVQGRIPIEEVTTAGGFILKGSDVAKKIRELAERS